MEGYCSGGRILKTQIGIINMEQGYFSRIDIGGLDDEFLRQELERINNLNKTKTMSVRAKFKVTRKDIQEHGETITLKPVVGGSPENEKFFKYTPSGEMLIGTINPDAASQFEVGKEYYIDFTKAN
jgi:hypothetical protein